MEHLNPPAINAPIHRTTVQQPFSNLPSNPKTTTQIRPAPKRQNNRQNSLRGETLKSDFLPSLPIYFKWLSA